MLAWLRNTRASTGFAALYALAMVTLGFAHQPVLIPAADEIVAAAYALPDGTLLPMCSHSGEQQPGGTHASHPCDACALAAAPGLAHVAHVVLITPVARRLALAFADEAQFSPTARHAPTSRGPPGFVQISA